MSESRQYQREDIASEQLFYSSFFFSTLENQEADIVVSAAQSLRPVPGAWEQELQVVEHLGSKWWK